MAADCRLHGRRNTHRENANYPSELPSKPHTSVCPSCVSNTLQVTVPLLKPKVSACEQVSLCMGHLRGHLCFPQLSIPPDGQNPHCFSQPDVVGDPLPGTSILNWIDWFVAGVPHSSWGNLCGQGIPLSSQPPATRKFGASPFRISGPPTSLDMAASLYP